MNPRTPTYNLNTQFHYGWHHSFASIAIFHNPQLYRSSNTGVRTCSAIQQNKSVMDKYFERSMADSTVKVVAFIEPATAVGFEGGGPSLEYPISGVRVRIALTRDDVAVVSPPPTCRSGVGSERNVTELAPSTSQVGSRSGLMPTMQRIDPLQYLAGDTSDQLFFKFTSTQSVCIDYSKLREHSYVHNLFSAYVNYHHFDVCDTQGFNDINFSYTHLGHQWSCKMVHREFSCEFSHRSKILSKTSCVRAFIVESSLNGNNGSYTNTDDHNCSVCNTVLLERGGRYNHPHCPFLSRNCRCVNYTCLQCVATHHVTRVADANNNGVPVPLCDITCATCRQVTHCSPAFYIKYYCVPGLPVPQQLATLTNFLQRVNQLQTLAQPPMNPREHAKFVNAFNWTCIQFADPARAQRVNHVSANPPRGNLADWAPPVPVNHPVAVLPAVVPAAVHPVVAPAVVPAALAPVNVNPIIPVVQPGIPPAPPILPVDPDPFEISKVSIYTTANWFSIYPLSLSMYHHFCGLMFTFSLFTPHRALYLLLPFLNLTYLHLRGFVVIFVGFLVHGYFLNEEGIVGSIVCGLNDFRVFMRFIFTDNTVSLLCSFYLISLYLRPIYVLFLNSRINNGMYRIKESRLIGKPVVFTNDLPPHPSFLGVVECPIYINLFNSVVNSRASNASTKDLIRYISGDLQSRLKELQVVGQENPLILMNTEAAIHQSILTTRQFEDFHNPTGLPESVADRIF